MNDHGILLRNPHSGILEMLTRCLCTGRIYATHAVEKENLIIFSILYNVVCKWVGVYWQKIIRKKLKIQLDETRMREYISRHPVTGSPEEPGARPRLREAAVRQRARGRPGRQVKNVWLSRSSELRTREGGSAGQVRKDLTGRGAERGEEAGRKRS